MRETTVCPLDCYDACRIILDEKGKLKGDSTHPVTQGYLCPKLNHYDEYERIIYPTYLGKAISMEDAIAKLLEILHKSCSNKTLFYRGSGNLGLMQRSMDHFFASFGGIGTRGSLCDGAGEAGIMMGRGVNYPLPNAIIEEAETVIIWGRNPEVTHSHLLPILKKKRLVVIDPICISLAQYADVYIQIKPACDLHLALLLNRLIIEKGLQNNEFLKQYGAEYHDFYRLVQTLPMKPTLEQIGVAEEELEKIIETMRDQKTVILVGTGVQKYRNGADVLRAIDAIGVLIGLFGRDGCGVSYLGNSLEGIELPFRRMEKKVPIPTLDFSQFETVFVQGGNPLAQMPNTQKVEKEFQTVPQRIYFGVYENETSAQCDLVIPAKSFLEKYDVRASYGDYTFQRMNPLCQSDSGISEYDLASQLCNHFVLSIPSQKEALRRLYDQMETIDGVEYKKNRPKIPYNSGFKTKSGKFEFIKQTDLRHKSGEGFFLISSKSSHALNSQFNRPCGIHLHSECGFAEDEEVNVSSVNGEIRMKVVYDDRLRHDCALIYAGTMGVNKLTPSLLSYDGESAVFQENKIKVEKC